MSTTICDFLLSYEYPIYWIVSKVSSYVHCSRRFSYSGTNVISLYSSSSSSYISAGAAAVSGLESYGFIFPPAISDQSQVSRNRPRLTANEHKENFKNSFFNFLS